MYLRPVKCAVRNLDFNKMTLSSRNRRFTNNAASVVNEIQSVQKHSNYEKHQVWQRRRMPFAIWRKMLQNVDKMRDKKLNCERYLVLSNFCQKVFILRFAR